MEAREYAWMILNKTVTDDAFTGNLLRKKREDMKEDDWNLAVRIIYGTLSNRLYLRYQWEEFKRGKLSSKLMNLIDMSVYQLVFLDRIPDYAVIDEAVNLAKSDQSSMAPVVNGILRSFARRGKKELSGSSREVLSLRTSVPSWLAGLWISQYGEETAVKLCEDTLTVKPTAFRVRKGFDPEEILKTNPGFRKGKIAENSLVAEGKIPGEVFGRNSLAVQDQSSQCVVKELDVRPGMKVLDMCAAPGTKTIQIAEYLEGSGEVHAYDVYPARVRLIKESVKKYGFGNVVKAKAYDARVLHECEEKESFDRVLLDAPCSGLGVLKDKPDMKYRVQGKDLDDCAFLQKELLKEAYEMLKEGGILVYSTCTLNKKENERQVAAFLKDHPDMQLLNERTYFPFEDENDGFYHAVLKKG